MNDLKRNGSGYVDQTAFEAIRNAEREELTKLPKVKRGDVYEYFTQNGSQQEALIVSCDERRRTKFISVLMLFEKEQKSEYAVQIICGTPKYVRCDMVAYASIERLGKFIRIATDEEMKAVDQKMAEALGLNVFFDEAYKENEQLKGRMEQYENSKIDFTQTRDGELSTRLELMTKNCDDLKTQILRLTTERDLYQGLAEKYLERLIGK